MTHSAVKHRRKHAVLALAQPRQHRKTVLLRGAGTLACAHEKLLPGQKASGARGVCVEGGRGLRKLGEKERKRIGGRGGRT
jgi:hypothetical protein